MLESGIQVAQSKEDEDTKRFAKEIADEVPLLNRALQATREALEKPKLADLDADIDATVEAVEKLSEQFKATEEKCKKMASYQEVLGLVADEYDALEEVAALVNMQQSLWTASRDFTKLTAQWKDLPVGSVSSDDLEKVRQPCYRSIQGIPCSWRCTLYEALVVVSTARGSWFALVCAF